MSGTAYNFNLYQGDVLNKIVRWLTSLGANKRSVDKHFRMAIRKSAGALPVLTLSSLNGGIQHIGMSPWMVQMSFYLYENMDNLELSVLDGVLTLHAGADELAAIAAGLYRYDLEAVPMALFDDDFLLDVPTGMPTDGIDTTDGVGFVVDAAANTTTITPTYTGGAAFHAFASVRVGDVIKVEDSMVDGSETNDGEFFVLNNGGAAGTTIVVAGSSGWTNAADTSCTISRIIRRVQKISFDDTSWSIVVDAGADISTITSAAGRPWEETIPLTPYNEYSDKFVTNGREFDEWQDIVQASAMTPIAVDVDAGGVVGHLDSGAANLFVNFEVGDYILITESEMDNEGVYQVSAVEAVGQHITLNTGTNWLKGADSLADQSMIIYRGQPSLVPGDWIALGNSRNGNNGFYQVSAVAPTVLTLVGTMPGTDEAASVYLNAQRISEKWVEKILRGLVNLNIEHTT